MSRRSNLIDIEVKIHHATVKAIFASIDCDKTKAVWIPLSQIEIDGEPWGVTTITIPEPLAIEKGLV
jgi:hypothetical protein